MLTQYPTSDIATLIGNTPLVDLSKFAASRGISASILAKYEGMNPGGSIKDRVALQMILDAEEQGSLKPGGTIIEPTSGNTGIGLALVAAVRGYSLILTMPESMSVERRKLLLAFGAKLVLTPAAKGMAGAVDEANRLNQSIPGSIILQQFDNPSNPKAHLLHTAPEIWEQSGQCVDIFVACIGTGGTVTGIGRYLKKQNPQISVVGVEPAESPIISQGWSGQHKIQGIGAGFVPANYDHTVVDEVLTVTSDDAIVTARDLASSSALLVGISSGAAVAAALQLSQRPENAGKRIVTVLPDTGQRYLSTDLYI